MAKEAKRVPAEPLRADPILPGESWRQYIRRLQSVPALGKAQMAGIMAATVLMGNDPDAPANGRMLDALAQRVGRQSSFRRLSRDPDALRLARGGKGAEMIVRMGEIKRQHDAMLRRYDRSAAQTAQDAVLFRAAVKSMKDSFANQSPAQRERESQRFLEMVKRLDHARSLAEQGIPLDGKSARELAQAVQFYNNGGSKTPGGKKQAAASKEAMCVLKRVMPEEDFKGYCADINRTHKAESPTHRRHADPNAYTEALLNGSARSARDLMRASQRQLSRGMTLDGCAAATAVMNLCQGNPNAIISREALEREVKQLKSPGSAFLRAMSDDSARGRYAQLANSGKAAALGRSILQDAKSHSVRAAQWQINESARAMGHGASVEKLADILAAREMALNANATQSVTNGAFKAKAEQIRSSPGFAALATQYRRDPDLRDRINQGLTNGDGGKALEQEYQKAKSPKKELEAPVLKA